MGKVNEQDLTAIVEHIGANLHLPQLVQHFDKSMIFDTDEKLVGQWIDGKILYQRSFNCGNLLNSGQLNFSHNIANIDKVWVKDGFAVSSDGATLITIPQVNPQYLERSIHCSADKNYIFIITGSDRSSLTGYVTICYTKTTDTALTYKLGSENDYSTEERLVGTWMGEPLYQKTVDCGNGLATSASVTVPHGVSNMGLCVGASGFWYTNDTTVPIPRAYSGTAWFDVNINKTNIILTSGGAVGSVLLGTYMTIRYIKTA